MLFFLFTYLICEKTGNIKQNKNGTKKKQHKAIAQRKMKLSPTEN